MNISLCDDREVWNAAVEELSGSIYQSWQWGELRKILGWKPWRVLGTVAGQPRVAAQILERGWPMLPYSVLYASRGILFRQDDLDSAAKFVEWIRGFLKSRYGVFLRVDPIVEDTDQTLKQMFAALGFRRLPDRGSIWNTPRAIMIVSLQPSEEELIRNMRGTHRRDIAHAQRRGLELELDDRMERLSEFYNLLLKSAEYQSIPVRSYHYYEILAREFNPKEGSILVLARAGGKPAAGILCARFGNVCYNLYAGFDHEFEKLRANPSVHWRAMQWAKAKGCRNYDMTGAGTAYPPHEGNWGYGLYQFKRGFGAELHYYAGYFDLVRLESTYSMIRYFEKNIVGRLHHLAAKTVASLMQFRLADS